MTYTKKNSTLLRVMPGLTLFFICLSISLYTYKDYGIAWDEPIQRAIGTVTYDYIVKNDQFLKSDEDRDLGTGFELPLVFVEKIFRLTDSQAIYRMRHLATHLFFLLSVLCAYFLFLRLFHSPYIAALGFIMLALEPRIYAHSFFNTKDIPFLSAFIFVFSVAEIAFKKNKRGWYLLLGVVAGYATSIRAMGIILVPCFVLFFIIDAFTTAGKRHGSITNCFVFLSGFCVALYIAWPILWSAPLFYFAEEFKTLAHIFWLGDVLFNGKVYNGAHLPLTYLPGWFSITVPELWLVTGLAGIAMLAVAFFKNPGSYLLRAPERNYILYAACFAGPVAAVLLLNAVNYDDWRHLYFIYPSFVLFALYAVNRLALSRANAFIALLSAFQLAIVIFFMVKSHPYQQVYFNNFVSHDREYLRKHYDLDYWGCAYMQGLKFILAHDTSDTVRVYRSMDPVINAIRAMPAAERKRILPVALDDHPNYFITNFRNHPDDYPYPENCYEIKVLNSTIMRVYKIQR